MALRELSTVTSTSVSPPTVSEVTRPTIREVSTVLSLLGGCTIVFVELFSASVRPVSVAAALLVALTIGGGLRTWWRARPKPVADHVLALLLTTTLAFFGLTMALGANS